MELDVSAAEFCCCPAIEVDAIEVGIVDVFCEVKTCFAVESGIVTDATVTVGSC